VRSGGTGSHYSFQAGASCLAFRKRGLLLITLGLFSTFLLLASGLQVALGAEGEKKVSQGKEAALITMDFKEADIRNVLRIISYESGVNIIPGPEVQGTVSVRVANVPWERALDAILKANGFAYVRDGNIIRVGTMKKLKEEELQTQTYFLNFATAATVKESLKEVLSERGKINTDARTNALVVTDIPSRLTAIQKIIKALDTETLQVSIEAKIIEVALIKGEELGINWGTEFSVTGAQRPTIWPFDKRSDSRWNPDDFPDAGGTGIGGDTTPFRFGILNATGLSAALKMIRQRTDSNILQSPRVTTLNNQEATITSGNQYPIPSYSYNSDRGQWEITGFEYLDLGVTLKVTPSVNRSGYIIMKVHPSVKELGAPVPFGTAQIPQYTTRETETQVMIKDGETIVIGGLMENKVQKDITKIPLLGDIPVLGYLFRRESSSGTKNKKTELVIFITARVVKPGDLQETDRLMLERLEYPKKERMDRIKKETVKGFYQLGKSYYRERKYEEAVEQFQKALTLDPAHSGARKYLRRVEEKLKKVRK